MLKFFYYTQFVKSILIFFIALNGQVLRESFKGVSYCLCLFEQFVLSLVLTDKIKKSDPHYYMKKWLVMIVIVMLSFLEVLVAKQYEIVTCQGVGESGLVFFILALVK